MATEREPTTPATMTNGDSNVGEGRDTKKLSPEAKPFTSTSSPTTSSLPTGRRKTTGDVSGSTLNTPFPPTRAPRVEQTEAYHNSGATVPLAPRPQWEPPRGPKSEEKKSEILASIKTPPHKHAENEVLIRESTWQQMSHDHAALRSEVEELKQQLEEQRFEFEAVGRPQPEVEALKEERATLVRLNRSQANLIRELQDKVEKLTIKPERLQSMYERYVKYYQEELDAAETRATTLGNKLKETQTLMV